MLAKDFLDGAPSAMVLGDNIFFGHDLPVVLKQAAEKADEADAAELHLRDDHRRLRMPDLGANLRGAPAPAEPVLDVIPGHARDQPRVPERGQLDLANLQLRH